MEGNLIFAYLLLVVGVCIIAYWGVSILLRKWEEAQKKKAEQTASKLEEMFIFLRPHVIVAIYIVVPLFFGGLAFIFTKNLIFSFIAIIIGAFIPLYLLKKLDTHRKKKFIMQLVDGLMIMNSCLKGGLTLAQSFEVLAEEMIPPLSQEIALLNRELKIGMPIEEALMRLNNRMPSEEMTLITSAVLVARETGGDLTKVFSKLIETIRDRIKLKELVTTLTLQARLQAIIISMLGPIFFIVVHKIKPDHFDIMWQSTLGRWLLLFALVLQILGMILIAMFGRIEI
ncbi:MAG: type II secretion system F family protein [Candidatus Omnitrophica bacterium]|nr:type II secretion system F family protein [Candidatus Omnitrophota bacterium]